MAAFPRGLALFTLVPAVVGYFQCSSGFDKKPDGDNAKCPGTESKYCNDASCCDRVMTCADYSAAWVVKQVGTAGCRDGDAKKFFDLKKLTTKVAAPQGDSEISAACCTLSSAATCADWVLNTCAPGDYVADADKTKAAAADAGKVTITNADFRTKCCSTSPKTCAVYQGAWIVAQALLGGCREGDAKKFFDNKKLTTKVAAPQENSEISAACCTLSSEATCADWAGVMTCALGDTVADATKAAPADAGGVTISDANFKTKCCSTPPKTCADFQVAWILAQASTAGCRKDDAKKFFDLKKSTAVVAAPQADSDIAAACCTPSADAICADWMIGMPSCPSGKYKLNSKSAPPDNANGVALSGDKYKELCCGDPMACKDWESRGSSVFQRTAAICTAMGMLAALRSVC